MAAPTTSYPTPVVATGDGSVSPGPDLSNLFPSVVPEVEQIVFQRVQEACSSRTIFPHDGQGLSFPLTFSIPPDVSLYKGRDGSYTVPVGPNKGQLIAPIPVARGWPAYPGAVPAIGVAESSTNEDPSGDTIAGGFAGDVFATDDAGNVIATCAYYAEPLTVTVVVELIHTNRDERDRLHDQLGRVLFPLKHLIASASPQVRDVKVDREKQDLPLDEQPVVIYVSLYTVQVSAEALFPTEIAPHGVISEIDVTVTPTSVQEPDAPADQLA